MTYVFTLERIDEKLMTLKRMPLLYATLLYTLTIFWVIESQAGILRIYASENLGVVNGEVVRNQIKIIRSLDDPVIFSFNKNKLNDELTALRVGEAKLILNHQGDVVFNMEGQLSDGGNINALISLGAWCNGNKISIEGSQLGNNVMVNLSIKDSCDIFEAKVTKPIKFDVPQLYRGEFDIALSINGVSH